jgi:hypothetical protein
MLALAKKRKVKRRGPKDTTKKEYTKERKARFTESSKKRVQILKDLIVKLKGHDRKDAAVKKKAFVVGLKAQIASYKKQFPTAGKISVQLAKSLLKKLRSGPFRLG